LRTVVLQLTWVVLTSVLALATQALLFKTASNSWAEVLTTHQWVGLLYATITLPVWARVACRAGRDQRRT
jgi:hypothetical protein